MYQYPICCAEQISRIFEFYFRNPTPFGTYKVFRVLVLYRHIVSYDKVDKVWLLMCLQHVLYEIK